MGVIKSDAADPLQTCTSIETSIEAAIKKMRHTFEQDETGAILMVDAKNAFNNLNCKAAFSNIKDFFPQFYQYLYNTYQSPANS